MGANLIMSFRLWHLCVVDHHTTLLGSEQRVVWLQIGGLRGSGLGAGGTHKIGGLWRHWQQTSPHGGHLQETECCHMIATEKKN